MVVVVMELRYCIWQKTRGEREMEGGGLQHRWYIAENINNMRQVPRRYCSRGFKHLEGWTNRV